MPPNKPVDPLPHLMERIARSDNGCWIWTQYCTPDGYGQARLTALGGAVLVHRAVYELTIGPVPEGLELDHLCRVRACCNPDHLEPVTHAENIARGEWEARKLAARAAQTHCRNGHEYTAENTRITKLGRRRCRACVTEWARRHKAVAA